MKKLAIYGTPITPYRLVEELHGESFCVSYWTKSDSQVERLIEIVGDMLMLDNGAYSAWKAGGQEPFLDPAYVAGYEAWALDILARCPQAVAVIPDTITGTVEQNQQLMRSSRLPVDRSMAVFHMHERNAHLKELLCGPYPIVAIGSSGRYGTVGTPDWHRRITEIMAIVDIMAGATGQRKRIHMMRAQAQHHRYDFDSSDSTNLAMNHCRYRHTGPGYVRRMAERIYLSVNGGTLPAYATT